MPLPFNLRPEGARTSPEYILLIKLDPMAAQEFQKLRLEILPLMMLLLTRDVGLNIGHHGLANRKAPIALLPGEMGELRKRLVDPLGRPS
jgi:hypothetical protein